MHPTLRRPTSSGPLPCPATFPSPDSILRTPTPSGCPRRCFAVWRPPTFRRPSRSSIKKLTDNAVRSTSMNRAWVCGGDYDGAEHPGSGCGALRDYTSTLSPPPSRDTCPTHAHAPPPTFRMILRLLRTWTRSDCGGTVHSCDYTRGLAAPTHIRLATARAVALL